MGSKYIFIIFLCLLLKNSYCQNEIDLGNTILTEREVAVDLDVPWEMVYGPDNFIWVTERKGKVLRINPENGNTNVVLDIQNKVYTDLEPGLMGMVMHHDFTNNPKVYLVYTQRDSSTTVFNTPYINLVSFDWDGVELSNEIRLLKVQSENIFSGNNHVGSRILISEDQKIFMTIGDGGSFSTAQDKGVYYGKILRINLDGSIPIDNPDPECYIYSYGHRNPQGLAFGRFGRIYSSEHGDQISDEINVILPSKNYGWPEVEGSCDLKEEISFCEANDVIEPIIEWTPCIAINDLLLYRHDAIPEWKNKLIAAALGGFSGGIPGVYVFELSNNGLFVLNESKYCTDYGRIRDLCVNPTTGAIYFATNGEYYPGEGPNRIIEYRNLNYETISNSKEIQNLQYLEIYPNIISSGSNINLKASSNFIGNSLSIYSYSGKLIREEEITAEEIKLNIHDLNKGKYFVKSTNENGTIAKSFLVF